MPAASPSRTDAATNCARATTESRSFAGTRVGVWNRRMSIPVPLDRLRAALAERPSAAYLLTVSDDGSPHAVHVAVAWDGERLASAVGKRSAANATARPAVSLLYPVRHDGDYSLIVDGVATVATDDGGARVLVAPSKGILHRPAAIPDPSASCAADCVPLTGESKAR